GLVQVDAVEENADAGVVIDVAIGDIHVASAISQVNGVPALADEEGFERRLHDDVDADAVSLGMSAFNLQVADRGHPLPLPDAVLEMLGKSGTAMRADQVQA